MTLPTSTDPRRTILQRRLLLGAATLQAVCGILFLADMLSGIGDFDRDLAFDLIGAVGLSAGLALSWIEYRRLLRRNHSVERELRIASGAFQAVLDQHFAAWGLSPAERDVALLSVKGLSNAEIAEIRQTRIGTIKAQTAAVYRKAGVSGRAELISVLIEDLIGGLGLPGHARQPEDEDAAVREA